MKKRREGGEEGLEQRAEDFMQFFVVHFCSREQVRGELLRWLVICFLFMYLLFPPLFSFFLFLGHKDRF